MATPQNNLELYQLARSVIWKYRIDQVENLALQKALEAVERASEDIVKRIKAIKKPGSWTEQRLNQVNKELWELSEGIRAYTSETIGTVSGRIGSEALKWHSNTLSVNGLVPVNMIAISQDQFKSFFEKNPRGKHRLTKWVDNTFDHAVRQSMERDLQAGLLQGKGYRGMTKDLLKYMNEGFTRKEAVSLAKTYTQTSNAIASEAVMRANDDIIKGWKWSSMLETSYMSTGRGVCLACAALDGEIFPVGEGPEMPLHHNCRCVKVFVTKTGEELGIKNTKELEETTRPWTYRENIPIGEGGRKIEEWGFHKGEYAKWFETRGDQFKINALGPRRFELWKTGDYNFKDFVDTSTGRLKTIKELL